MLTGSVLLTGGTGFLGRGILRRQWPAEITVLSRDETKQAVCKERYSNAKYVLGDVTNPDTLDIFMKDIDTVIHAAAIKYIPEAEHNARECVQVNVLGTKNVIEACLRNGVQRAVFISTDKAVQPVNTYGASKMLGERMWQEASLRGTCNFTFTRYGNVIGSTGSVIPLFAQQVAQQGFVTVTDPDMTRFWITIEEAVDLVEEALDAPNGVGIIPYAPSMKIGDIALAMANDIRIIGRRPGEKLYEELIHAHESVNAYECNDRGRMQLYPPIAGMNLSPIHYHSDNPRAWVTREELLEAIQDAATV